MMDKFTEEISHFIGFFHVSVETTRAREAYNEFALSRSDVTIDELPVQSREFAAPFDLLGFDPGFGYRSPAPDHWYVVAKSIAAHPTTGIRTVSHPVDDHAIVDRHTYGFTPAITNVKYEYTLPQLDTPGSVVNHFSQAISLSDNDYFSVGGHGLTFDPRPVDNADALEGYKEATALSPLGDQDRPGSSDDAIQVIKSVIEDLENIDADSSAAQLHLTSPSINGTYVNGELVEDLPDISNYRTLDNREHDGDDTAEASGPNTWLSDDGTISVEVAVQVHTGANTLINNAVLQNFWTGATITLVGADHVEVDAIVQINALWDRDTIVSELNNLTSNTANNEIFNIASFDHVSASDDESASVGGYDDYPAFWAVTEVQGDLMIVNWIEQIVFMNDNDIGILSSSGVTTNVVAGDNFSVNHASVFELGFFYDLIIVGGSVFDANIIQQMNILFDNDFVGAAASFETFGEGSVSSSGNLLWNQARITTIGEADRFDSLTPDQSETMASFANGTDTIAPDLLFNEQFAGLQGLRVLHITGDLINLQYISQTNILGDSDQIALAMDAIAPNLDANWTVETGSNALVNNATIIDLDSLGKTYVGGEQYSQETLFQAELISQQPDFCNPNTDALVNEAVLFLDDSMLDQDEHSTASEATLSLADYDGSMGDGVNSMIGH